MFYIFSACVWCLVFISCFQCFILCTVKHLWAYKCMKRVVYKYGIIIIKLLVKRGHSRSLHAQCKGKSQEQHTIKSQILVLEQRDKHLAPTQEEKRWSSDKSVTLHGHLDLAMFTQFLQRTTHIRMNDLSDLANRCPNDVLYTDPRCKVWNQISMELRKDLFVLSKGRCTDCNKTKEWVAHARIIHMWVRS
jgi:hypothetical protein